MVEKIQTAKIEEKYNLDNDFSFYKNNKIKLRYTYKNNRNKKISSFVIPE